MTALTTISIPNDARLHRILAEAVVEVSHPGYQRKGWYVNINTWEVFSPVNDIDADDCIDVTRFFDPVNDYDPSVDWDLQWGENSFLKEILVEWARQESEDPEIFANDGSLAEWVTTKASKKSAVEWGWSQPQWQDQLRNIEQANYENAVEFAQENILEVIEIEA